MTGLILQLAPQGPSWVPGSEHMPPAASRKGRGLQPGPCSRLWEQGGLHDVMPVSHMHVSVNPVPILNPSQPALLTLSTAQPPPAPNPCTLSSCKQEPREAFPVWGLHPLHLSPGSQGPRLSKGEGRAVLSLISPPPNAGPAGVRKLGSGVG